MYANQNSYYRQGGSQHVMTANATSPGSPPLYSQSFTRNRMANEQQNYSDMTYLHGAYKSQPLLYPFKDGNFDILYSEEGDGEILVETLSPEEGGQLRLITCVDISTLYKEKRNKAIEIAKEYSKLHHPNILSMTSEFELLDNNGTLMFFTEAPDHIAGWKSYCKKKFTTDEMLCIFRQLCEALAYVHEQGLIHRDVHPTRIHSTFGLAKFNLIGMPYNYKKLLKKDNFCGHVNYSAPELIQEKFIFSPKVDIWSLGCCLYYLCTKKDPFEGRNPQEIKQNIMIGRLERYPSKFDPILRTLINKCLEKDENKRLNAREMLEYQNTIEIEAYGEVRSSIMLKSMMEEYNQISSNPLVHKQNTSSDSADYYEKGIYANDERYNNPHFFSSSRFPFQSQISKPGQELQVKETDPGNTSMICRSPESSNMRDPSLGNQNNNHSLYTFARNSGSQSIQDPFRGTKFNYIKSETSSLSGFQGKRATFQSDYKTYQTNQGTDDSSLSKFARATISENLQNNMTQFYNRQQTGHNQYIQGAPSLHQVNAIKTGDSQSLMQEGQPLSQMAFPTFNVAQPNKATQPQKIVLPKQEHIQRQMKQYQDKIDPPLPPLKNQIEESKYQGKSESQGAPRNSYQRFNLTQSNLSMFNSQNQAQTINDQDTRDSVNNKEQTNKEEAPPSSQQPSTFTDVKGKDSAKDQSAADFSYSIFNAECIFATSKNNHNDSSADDINSDTIKDAVLQQDDNPSSGESRNELNKDEIEGIVAQMVESSKRVKNQLHYFDGTKYVGEVMRHGRGIYYDQDGSIYDGEWYEDQRSGKGKILFTDGSVYDGQWEADKIHGKGIYLSSNGDRYEGHFNLGMKEGFGAMYYRNGNTYQGQWHNDQIWGKGVFHFKTGNYYEGNFVNGNFDGQGLMFFVGIGTYNGSFRSGNLEGIGRFEYLNSSNYDGEWKENRKHGRGQLVEADGRSIYIGDWENDLKHGKGTFIQKGAYMIEGVWNRGSLVEMTKFANQN